MNFVSMKEPSLYPAITTELKADALSGVDVNKRMRAYVIAGSNVVVAQCYVSATNLTAVANEGPINVRGFWFTA